MNAQLAIAEQNKSLKPFNTFGIDASAKHFVQVTSVEELRTVSDSSLFKENPVLILGGGSNILLTKNFEGLVVKINLPGISLINEDEHHYYVKAGAGEVWHNLVKFCIENNYAGIENLSLIPGNVGAAPMQNIGAYGMELKDVFYNLDAFFPATGEIKTFDKPECNFGYRESIFKHELKNKCVITSVTFRLLKQPEFNTSYGAIEEELRKMNIKNLSIKAISNAVTNIRSSKLPNPAEIGNAGSFFKNPVINSSHFENLKNKFPDIIGYPAGEGQMKVAAGWLIEKAGWKGKTMGNYGVHKKQALVLVNYGGAAGNEIYKLSQDILDDIKNKFEIELEREVNIF
jgi:UDP-N-acetylmuramate dehydrogenase